MLVLGGRAVPPHRARGPGLRGDAVREPVVVEAWNPGDVTDEAARGCAARGGAAAGIDARRPRRDRDARPLREADGAAPRRRIHRPVPRPARPRLRPLRLRRPAAVRARRPGGPRLPRPGPGPRVRRGRAGARHGRRAGGTRHRRLPRPPGRPPPSSPGDGATPSSSSPAAVAVVRLASSSPAAAPPPPVAAASPAVAPVARPPSRPSSLGHVDAAVLLLAEAGLAGGGAAVAESLRRAERVAREDGLPWPADVCAELADLVERHAAGDAAFDPVRVAQLVGEAVLRGDVAARAVGARAVRRRSAQHGRDRGGRWAARRARHAGAARRASRRRRRARLRHDRAPRARAGPGVR